MTSFEGLGLGAPLQKALAGLQYTTPTPIQADALPVALAGRDLIACAQTGSGKTAVFVLPYLQRVLSGANSNGHGTRTPRCLVLVPTRELAIQVEASFRSYGRNVEFRSTAVYGGVGYGAQYAALRRGVDVLVATPGRLLDLIERQVARLDRVQYLVLDEADRMLDLGFLPQVRRVVTEGRVPTHGRQTLLFSATMPPQIAQLAKDLLTNPARVESEAPMTAVDTIEQRLYPVAQTQKATLLAQLLREESVESALIFTRTRRRADSLSRALSGVGLANATIHSGVAQNQRERALTAFRQGKIKFLVATDVASRGLDIPLISHVVNHDVPDAAEDYVHRIGRTGRAGRSGIAITLYSHTDEALWQAVEKLTANILPASRLPGFRYEVDTSVPELTRRQRVGRDRAERATRVLATVSSGGGGGGGRGGPRRRGASAPTGDGRSYSPGRPSRGGDRHSTAGQTGQNGRAGQG